MYFVNIIVLNWGNGPICLSAEGVKDRKGCLTIGSVFCWLLIYVSKNIILTKDISLHENNYRSLKAHSKSSSSIQIISHK